MKVQEVDGLLLRMCASSTSEMIRVAQAGASPGLDFLWARNIEDKQGYKV